MKQKTNKMQNTSLMNTNLLLDGIGLYGMSREQRDRIEEKQEKELVLELFDSIDILFNDDEFDPRETLEIEDQLLQYLLDSSVRG